MIIGGNGCLRGSGDGASVATVHANPWSNTAAVPGPSAGKALEDGIGFGGAEITLAAGEESDWFVSFNYGMDQGADPWPSDGTFVASQYRIQIAEITSDPGNGASYNGRGSICECRQWTGGDTGGPVGDDLKGDYAADGALRQAVNPGAASELSIFCARDDLGRPVGSPGHTTTSAEMRASGSGYGIRVKNNHPTDPLTVGIAWASRFGVWSKSPGLTVTSNKADVIPDPFILVVEAIQSAVGTEFMQHEVWVDWEFEFPEGYDPQIDGGCPLEGSQNGDTRSLSDCSGGWVMGIKLVEGVTRWRAHLRSARAVGGEISTLASSDWDSVTVPARSTRTAKRFIDNTGDNGNDGLTALTPMHDIGGVFNDVGLVNVEVSSIPNGHISLNGTVNVGLEAVAFTQGDPDNPATVDGSVRWAGGFKQVVFEGFKIDNLSMDVSSDPAADAYLIDCTGVTGHGTTSSLLANSSQGEEGRGGILANIRGLTCTDYGAFWGWMSRCIRYGNHFIMDRDHTADGVERTTGIADSSTQQRGQLFTSFCNTWECKDNGPTGDFNQSWPVGVRYFGGHIFERENRYINSAPAAHPVNASQSDQLAVWNARFDRIQCKSDIGSHPNFGLPYIYFSNAVVEGPLNDNRNPDTPELPGDLSNLIMEISGSIEQFTLANVVLAPRRDDTNAIVARFATIGRSPQIRLINVMVAPVDGLGWHGFNFLDNDAETREIQSIRESRGCVWNSGGDFQFFDEDAGYHSGDFTEWELASFVSASVVEDLVYGVDLLPEDDFVAPLGSNARTIGAAVDGNPWDFRGVGRNFSLSWAAGATGTETPGGGGAPDTPVILSATINAAASTYTEVWSTAVHENSGIPDPPRTLHGASNGTVVGSLQSGNGTTTLVYSLVPVAGILFSNTVTVDIPAGVVLSVSDGTVNGASVGHAVVNHAAAVVPGILSMSVDPLGAIYSEVWSTPVVPGGGVSRTLHGASGDASLGSLQSGSGTATLNFAISPAGVILHADVLLMDVATDSVESVHDGSANGVITGRLVLNNVPVSGGGGSGGGGGGGGSGGSGTVPRAQIRLQRAARNDRV